MNARWEELLACGTAAIAHVAAMTIAPFYMVREVLINRDIAGNAIADELGL